MAANIGLVSSLGYLREFRRDPIALMDELQLRHGDLVVLRLGPKRIFFCFHPSHAEQILKRRADQYRKSQLIFRKIRPLTGPRGLVQLEGDEGRDHRLLTSPAVGSEALQANLPQFRRNICGAFEPLDRAADHGRPVDLAEILMHIVLKNATRLVLGDCADEDVSKLLEAFLRANALCGRSIRQLASLPLAIPTPRNVALKRTIRSLDEVADRMIDERQSALTRHGSPAGRDLLTLLLGTGLERSQIRDHLMTYLFAGYETTAASLVWTFFLLARHLEVFDRVRRECASFAAASDIDLNGLRKLSESINVYQESLRLFPPAWTLAREAVQDDEIDGIRVPQGALCLLGVRQIHTHASFWQAPHEFRPQRFAEPAGHPYAFIPFGAGSRLCVGVRAAMVEATLVVAMLTARYRFEVEASFEPAIEAMITAHPKAGLPVTVRRVGD